MPREREVSIGAGAIQPQAQGVDRIFITRPPRGETLNLAPFTKALTQALVTRELSEGTDKREEGDREFVQFYAEAEAESRDTAMAFQKAVARGQLDEAQNPYFRTGFVEAAARAMSARWMTLAEQDIREIATLPGTAGTETGTPVAAPNPMALANSRFDSLYQSAVKSDPSLAENPWFQRELSRQRQAGNARLFDLGQKVEADKLKRDHYEALSVEGIQLVQDAVFNSADKAEGIKAVESWITEKVRRGGIADPAGFTMGVVSTAFEAILVSGEDGSAKRAQEFIERVGGVKIGTQRIDSGLTAPIYGKLVRAAEGMVQQEEFDAEKTRANREKAFLHAFEDTDRVREVLAAPNSSAALQMVNGMRQAVLDGTTDIPHEFGNEALTVLTNAALSLRPFDQLERDQFIGQINGLLDEGRPEEARALVGAGPGFARREALSLISSFENDTATFLNSDPAYAEELFELRTLAKNGGTTLNDRSADGNRSENRRDNIEFQRRARAAIQGLTPDDRREWMSTEFPKLKAETEGKIRERIEAAEAKDRDLFDKIKVSWDKFGDATDMIREAEESGFIDRDAADKLRKGNAQATMPRRSALALPLWKKTATDIQKAVLNAGNYEIKADRSIDPNPLVDSGLVNYIKPRIGSNDTPKFALTPKGVQQIDSLVRAGRDYVEEFFDNPPEEARGNPLRMEQLAQERVAEAVTAIRSVLESDAPLSAFLRPSSLLDFAPADEEADSDSEGEESSFLEPESGEIPNAAAQSPRVLQAARQIENPERSPTRILDRYAPEIKDALSIGLPAILQTNSNLFDGKHEAILREFLAPILAPELAAVISFHYGQDAFPDLVSLRQAVAPRPLNKNEKPGPMAFTGFGRTLPTMSPNEVFGEIQTRVDAVHPYPLAFEVYRRFEIRDTNAEGWLRYARENADKVAQKVFGMKGMSRLEKEQASIAAFQMVGAMGAEGGASVDGDTVRIPYVGAIQNPTLIPWQTMPLYGSLEALHEAWTQDTEGVIGLMEKMGLVVGEGDPGQDPVFQQFIAAQERAIIRMTKRD